MVLVADDDTCINPDEIKLRELSVRFGTKGGRWWRRLGSLTGSEKRAALMDLSDDEDAAVGEAAARGGFGTPTTPPLSSGSGGVEGNRMKGVWPGTGDQDFEVRREAWRATAPSDHRRLSKSASSGRDGFRGRFLICGWRQDMVSRRAWILISFNHACFTH